MYFRERMPPAKRRAAARDRWAAKRARGRTEAAGEGDSLEGVSVAEQHCLCHELTETVHAPADRLDDLLTTALP